MKKIGAMQIGSWILFLALFSVFYAKSQNFSGVYKINDLVKRVKNQSDTLYVVNFWATWCKPCVSELPDFEAVNDSVKGSAVKVLLVSMDFKEDVKSKLQPFLKKNDIQTEVVLLDELNGNDFIDKIDKNWTGAIPATLFVKRGKQVFAEKKLNHFSIGKIMNEFSE